MKNILDNNSPTVECSDGTKEWHKCGVLHRIDGPAIEYSNNEVGWYLDGVGYIDITDYLENNYYLTLDEKVLLKLFWG